MPSPMSRPPIAADPDGASAPPSWLFVTDPARAMAEFGLLVATLPLRQLLPIGDEHPVLVLPGLLADDDSTWTLRRMLRDLGYRVHGWRLGRNLGPTAATVTGLQNRLLDLRSRYDSELSVIGWSLGGIFARRAFDRYAHLHVVPKDLPLESGLKALPVPATSIYSRYDGIVAWQACLDVPSARAENIAVVGSHLGFGHHPAVIWAVADRLAQPPGEWAPFRPPAALRPLYPPADSPPPQPWRSDYRNAR
jgi:hypothetical protein